MSDQITTSRVAALFVKEGVDVETVMRNAQGNHATQLRLELEDGRSITISRPFPKFDRMTQPKWVVVSDTDPRVRLTIVCYKRNGIERWKVTKRDGVEFDA